ncbi:adenylate kinase [Candidatus Micrarchaeota archaeon CG08_land_8_20_14_0_20_59_11]|nr:MAG: adenylate kinase [Candidatus Micrarchaeota archaeon CG08_land_8_20_14_0_20_59_11]
MKIVLLGAPGSGKGTQADLLSKSHGVPNISAGDLLREEVKKGSALGLKAKSFMERGELVPDELVLEMMKPFLSKSFILDGFPRTINQAEALEKITRLDAVVELEAPRDVLLKRLTGRWTCAKCGAIYHESRDDVSKCAKCGGKLYQRDDQKPSVIAERLRVYEAQTKPLSDFYASKGLLKRVASEGTPEDVAEKTEAALKNR